MSNKRKRSALIRAQETEILESVASSIALRLGYIMIIVDGNSIGFAATAGKTLHSGSVETGGVYNFVNIMRDIRERYLGEIVVCWDGRSWRYEAYSNYKSGRQANPELVALKDRWKAQKKFVVKALNYMGIRQVFASNMEADDLAAKIAARYTKKITFITGDGDWLQLIKGDDVVVDRVRRRESNIKNMVDRTGYDTTRQFVESKALTGDVSDSISGVGGIGPVGAKLILTDFGTVENLLASKKDLSDYPKQIRDFVSSTNKIEKFHSNLLLVDLNHPDVPKPKNLQIVHRSINKEALSDLFGELAFISLLRDFERWIEPFESV
jgi:5'-3' exonuclease